MYDSMYVWLNAYGYFIFASAIACMYVFILYICVWVYFGWMVISLCMYVYNECIYENTVCMYVCMCAECV